jgi:TolB-like protein
VLAQVQRIVASTIFSKSARMQRFIEFAARHEVSGAGDPLKEYVIGINVFDRRPSYDPRIDPIVRVEARRLRTKLTAYYASAGRGDPILIDVPKGTYTPVFRTRPAAPAMIQVMDNPTRAPAVHGLAVTVLPFAALSTTAIETAFAAGLTEEVLHRLAGVRDLRLLVWTPGTRWSDDFDGREPARDQENATILLRGSVRCDARHVRVIAQCIDASSQTCLWSEAYNRARRNVLWMEDKIAQAIAAKVAVTLRPAKDRMMVWRPPRSSTRAMR